MNRLNLPLVLLLPGFLSFAVGCGDSQSAPGTDNMAAIYCCDAVDSLISASIDLRRFPAAAIAIGTDEEVVKVRGYGSHTYDDSASIVNERSLFDLASLTKVVATTTSVMLLHERGQLDLDRPVATYLPEFAANGKSAVTVRQLLRHRGGLAPFHRFYTFPNPTRDVVVDGVLADSLHYAPGEAERYSDLGFITLGLLVERVSGQTLAEFTRDEIFAPLGMADTGFRGTDQVDQLVVPTEYDSLFRGSLVQGVVHDENAFVMGGTAGHAGLFSTAHDLALFARMLAGRGTLDGQRFLAGATVDAFVNRDLFPPDQRGLGWDFKSLDGYTSAGALFGPKSYGHTGFTGTSLWIDPDARVFAILLTNRVYPTRANRGHIAVRPEFGDAAFELAAPSR